MAPDTDDLLASKSRGSPARTRHMRLEHAARPSKTTAPSRIRREVCRDSERIGGKIKHPGSLG